MWKNLIVNFDTNREREDFIKGARHYYNKIDWAVFNYEPSEKEYFTMIFHIIAWLLCISLVTVFIFWVCLVKINRDKETITVDAHNMAISKLEEKIAEYNYSSLVSAWDGVVCWDIIWIAYWRAWDKILFRKETWEEYISTDCTKIQSMNCNSTWSICD